MSAPAADAPAGRSVAVTINSGVISTGDHATVTVRMPTPVPEARWGLRASTPAFSSREADLDDLLALLSPEPPGGGPGLVALVTGMAGIGKTEFAVRAAHLAIDRAWFPGGVLFTDMHGYDDARRIEPTEALEGFLRALGIPGEHIPPVAQDRQRLFRSVLTEFSRDGQRILIVVDNVAGSDQVRPLLPADQSTRVIVTSRHTLTGLGARRVDLDVFDEANAVALLDRAVRIVRGDRDTRVQDDPAAAAALAGLCGRLPLALVIVAALLAEIPAKPLSAMAAELGRERDRLARLALADDAADPGSAVRAAFDLSYRRLPAGQALMFRLLSLNPGPDVGAVIAATLVECGVPEAEDLLAALARAHLVEPGRVYGRWKLHDLVRLYSDELGREHAESDGRDQAGFRLLATYTEYTQHAVEHLVTISGLIRPKHLFDDLGGALAWLDAEYPNIVAAVRLATDTGHDEFAQTLAWDISHHLTMSRRYAEILTVSELTLGAARRLGSRAVEAASYNAQGIALAGTRRFPEAAAAYKRALEIYSSLGDHGRLAAVLNNLSVASEEEGRFAEASDTMHRGRAMSRDDQNGEAVALGNLGISLMDTGRFAEAATTFQRAAEILEGVGDRHRLAGALTNLGTAHYRVGGVDEAIDTHRRAASIYRELDDANGEGAALNNLGNELSKVRRDDEAVTALRRAVTLLHQAGNPRDESRALKNLGEALEEADAAQEAMAAYRHSLDLARSIGDQSVAGMALMRLGGLCEKKQRLPEAVDHYTHAARAFFMAPDRRGEARAANALGDALESSGLTIAAVVYRRRAADLYGELGDKPLEGHTTYYLGHALLSALRIDDAIEAFRRAAEICREAGEHRCEGMALGNLGRVYFATNHPTEAREYWLRAVEVFREADMTAEATRIEQLLGLLA